MTLIAMSIVLIMLVSIARPRRILLSCQKHRCMMVQALDSMLMIWVLDNPTRIVPGNAEWLLRLTVHNEIQTQTCLWTSTGCGE